MTRIWQYLTVHLHDKPECCGPRRNTREVCIIIHAGSGVEAAAHGRARVSVRRVKPTQQKMSASLRTRLVPVLYSSSTARPRRGRHQQPTSPNDLPQSGSLETRWASHWDLVQLPGLRGLPLVPGLWTNDLNVIDGPSDQDGHFMLGEAVIRRA